MPHDERQPGQPFGPSPTPPTPEEVVATILANLMGQLPGAITPTTDQPTATRQAGGVPLGPEQRKAATAGERPEVRVPARLQARVSQQGAADTTDDTISRAFVNRMVQDMDNGTFNPADLLPLFQSGVENDLLLASTLISFWQNTVAIQQFQQEMELTAGLSELDRQQRLENTRLTIAGQRERLDAELSQLLQVSQEELVFRRQELSVSLGIENRRLAQEQQLALFDAAVQNPFAFAAAQQAGLVPQQIFPQQAQGQAVRPGQFVGPIGEAPGFTPAIQPAQQELANIGFFLPQNAFTAITQPGAASLQSFFPGGIPGAGQIGGLGAGATTLLESTLGLAGISPDVLEEETRRRTPVGPQRDRATITPGARR